MSPSSHLDVDGHSGEHGTAEGRCDIVGRVSSLLMQLDTTMDDTWEGPLQMSTCRHEKTTFEACLPPVESLTRQAAGQGDATNTQGMSQRRVTAPAVGMWG